MSSTGTSNSRCASISSRPLFISEAEFTVTTGPIAQVGWASASSTVTFLMSSRLRPRNGPPDAVSTMRRTSSRAPPRSACAMAECSESTGTIWPGAAAAFTSAPPTTSDSLFASARLEPAASAASVGRSPTEPVMPLSTTSSPRPASSVAAPGPATTSTVAASGPSRATSASRRASTLLSSATPTAPTPRRAACSASSVTSPPPALIAVTRNRPGWASTTSIA